MFDWKPVHRANAGAGVDWLRKLVSHLLVIVKDGWKFKAQKPAVTPKSRRRQMLQYTYHHIQIR